MNEKPRRNRLNDAFKRFQRLPLLPTKGDTRASVAEKPTWQALPFGLIGHCSPAHPGMQSLTE
jgi:hypothetical protein